MVLKSGPFIMTEVHLSREFYSSQARLIDWCRVNIGPGGWEECPTILCPDKHQWVWSLECTFGCSIFRFDNDEDAKRFRIALR